MFKLISSDINIFKSSFGAISNIVNIVQMNIDNNGIEVTAIDSSHITFLHLFLNESIFDVYECDTSRTIYFDSNEFMIYLKRVNKDSLLELTVDDNYITIHSEGSTNKTFKMKLLHPSSTVPPIPEIDFPVKIQIPTKTFKDSIADVQAFTQKVKLLCDNEILKFIALGDFVDMEIEWEHKQSNTINVSKGYELFESCYSLDKIKEMMKADKFSRDCTLYYGTEMPLKVELSSSKDEILSFLLAPRIEDE